MRHTYIHRMEISYYPDPGHKLKDRSEILVWGTSGVHLMNLPHIRALTRYRGWGYP